MIKKTILFFILNFAALAIGGFFTGSGVSSDWYQNMNQAPWTPPGWVFGAAWTTIMICFSFYMARLVHLSKNKKRIITFFVFQWILNVGWNPIFFYFRDVSAGLVIISSLTILVAFFLFNYRKQMSLSSLLVLPYFIWLMIATSLNAYIFFQN
jgi:tryptophan-rich sensory protein